MRPFINEVIPLSLSHAVQEKNPYSTDQQFSPAFYQPYRIAVQTAFAMLCHTRRLLCGDLGEETVQQMTFRLKTPQSISGKLRKKKLPVTCDAASAALHDIAGLRVVLSSVDAVYRFAALLTASPLAEFVSCRDYIASPKQSGYQSLHLLMVIPVIDQGQHLLVPIEIQLRTSQMDAWAVIDHESCYKPHRETESGERRWAAAQTCLGISSSNPFFAPRCFTLHSSS